MRNLHLFFGLGLAGAMMAAAACGSDNSNATPTPVGSATHGSTTSGAGGAGSTTSGAGGNSAGAGGTGSGGSGGCFKGMPKSNDDFLNACSDASQCIPFTTPLPKLNPDGSLPKLPQ